VNILLDNPMTQFSFEWILSLNWPSQFWGPLHTGSGLASVGRRRSLVTGGAPFAGCARSLKCKEGIHIDSVLLEGVPIERVSVLLGHSSVKITERHYAPWVQARQAQLETDLMRAWRNDPIAQRETLRGAMDANQGGGLQMPATYPRHEKGEAPNRRNTRGLVW
jgi:hypothetical protein